MIPPREVPDWDSFYLGLAYQYAERSKDPSTQCGAVIVDPNNAPLGFGCNGGFRNINDKEIDWGRPQKYFAVKHAEANAIDHARINSVDGLKGCTIYVTGHPCSACMARIVDRGIKRVCFGPLNIKMVDKEDVDKGRQLAGLGGVRVDTFQGNLRWVLERTKFMEQMGLFRETVWH